MLEPPLGSTEEIPVRGWPWRDTSRDEMYVCMSNVSLSSVSDASGCSMIALLHTGAAKFPQNLLPRARQAVCSLLRAGVLKGYSSIVSRKLASHGFGASMAAMSSFPPQRYHYFLVLDFEATCDKPQIHPQVNSQSCWNYPLASCCGCSERWKEKAQCWLTRFLWFVLPPFCCWSSRALASHLLSQEQCQDHSVGMKWRSLISIKEVTIHVLLQASLSCMLVICLNWWGSKIFWLRTCISRVLMAALLVLQGKRHVGTWICATQWCFQVEKDNSLELSGLDEVILPGC